MNKDLYIALLEEHVGGLTTAMKIDAVLSLRKTEKNRGLKSELVSSRNWNNVQDELISKIADTTLDCMDDLNDAQAECAELYNEYMEKLTLSIERVTRANDENVRLQSKIAVFEADNEKLTDERDRSRNTNRLLRENLKAME